MSTPSATPPPVPPAAGPPAAPPLPRTPPLAPAGLPQAPLLPPPGTPLRLGPAVTLTPLPFGGAVLAHGRTLAVAEYGERDAEVLARLLGVGVPPPEAGAPVARFTAQLIAAGWLVPERSA
ncbi:actinodefensin-associated protein B [Streptomyces bambusae]|uniref:Mycofactocin biosynthesis chaperone MftB n=1 Tax=Streptomyces bambusae TaxID=1550616 RepID=A0ABS6Z3J3_9ACTN|nr:actinodefensin-associated protein B [Streptomyces bambusae]MBW5481280.1 hypothetical protein [Streptomyces bambusae]